MLIAHDPGVQSMMDRLGIIWPVQYELARGVSTGLWTWADITAARLRELARGDMLIAQKVSDVMGKQLSGQKVELW
jgi:RNA-dependent RNA polymerase